MVDSRQPFQIRDWEVQPQLNRLTNGQQTVQLEPRVMHVLVCLAERQGEVVSRDELLEAVWPDVVVGDESLTGAVSELRRVFGDDARSPRYIETIRKVGYRLAAPARRVDAADVGVESSDLGAVRSRSRVGAWLAVTGLLLVAVVVAGAWQLWRDRDRRAEHNISGLIPLEARPFTSYPGMERMPAISPDGTRVAFAWSGREGDDPGSSREIDIYVKQANTEVPLKLTDHPGVELNPAWSPEGTEISYLHIDADGSAIYVVPSIGGRPRRLITAPGLKGQHSWSPDGRFIAYAEAQGLFVHDLETGARRRLTVPPVSCCGDMAPVYSPDGRHLAFIRMDTSRLQDLYLVAVGGGDVQRMTRGMLRIEGFDWTRDGASLVCSSVRNGSYQLWRIEMKDGTVEPVATRGAWAIHPSIARQRDRMVYMDVELEANIWQVQREGEAAEGVLARPLVTSTRADVDAAYSPDGTRIAFTSHRSGSLELWTCNSDGSDPLRVTSFGGITVVGPCWSPDAARIAFTAVPGETSDVYVVSADAGGNPRRLTRGDHNDHAVGWTSDGSELYVASDRTGEWQLFRMDPDDSEVGLDQVTHDGAIVGIESPDGSALFVARPDQAGLWRLPLEDHEPVGDAVRIVDDAPIPGLQHHWDVCVDGVVFARYGQQRSRFDMYSFETGDVQPLVGDAPEISSVSISVSPDCRSILFGHVESGTADLMMVDGFR